jgi:ABC-type sugar transport system substrate-binding protein
MMKVYRFLSLLIVLLLVISMVGTAFAAAPSQGKKYTIGAIVPTLDAQFWNNYYEFMKKGAAELGVDLVLLNADNKADQMSKYIEDLVAKKVDGIIFVPYWSTGVKGLTDAKAANIPVILADSYISDVAPQSPDYPNYIGFIGPSDEAAGYAMANALFAAMAADPKDNKKYIGVVDGTPGTSVAIDRHKGLDRALKEHPEVVVSGTVNGNFVRDESQTAFESLYQGHPEIKGVWAANGGTATGVMTAIKNAGKMPGKDIMVVGMDLNPENVTAVKNGELLFDIGGHWLQGGFALVMMLDYLNGHKITPAQANVKLDLLPLTKDLVPQFEKDFPNGVPTYDFKAHSQTFTPSAPPAFFEMKYSVPITSIVGVNGEIWVSSTTTTK